METGVGPRALARVIPRWFKDLHALHLATGIAYSTVHAWSKGSRMPSLEHLELVCQKARERGATLEVSDLLRVGEVVQLHPQLKTHPQWPEVSAAVVRRYRRRLPPYTVTMAGETSYARMPETLSEQFVYDAAEFWWRHATDEELSRGEAQLAEEEIARETEKAARGK